MQILSKKRKLFLQSINRGGLCTASDLVYIPCTHVFNFHEKIFGDTEFRKLLLDFPSPRVVFIASLKMLVEERKWLVQAFFESQCGSGHKFRDIFSVLAKCVFNICSKNFCSETNSTRAKRERICRLQNNQAMPKSLLNCSNNILVQSIIYQLFFHL